MSAFSQRNIIQQSRNMKFTGKLVKLGTIILNEVTQTKKDKKNLACFLSYMNVILYVFYSEYPPRLDS